MKKLLLFTLLIVTVTTVNAGDVLNATGRRIFLQHLGGDGGNSYTFAIERGATFHFDASMFVDGEDLMLVRVDTDNYSDAPGFYELINIPDSGSQISKFSESTFVVSLTENSDGISVLETHAKGFSYDNGYKGFKLGCMFGGFALLMKIVNLGKPGKKGMEDA